MSLREIEYQEDYRSGNEDLLRDFFHPSLRKARDYWRAVGYFSSSALEAFGTPLGEFVKKGGTIRLVTSVELSESDLKAIELGTSKRQVCRDRIETIIEQQFTDGVEDGVTHLGLLLEVGRLDIKIAVPRTGTGIYHEKIGIFFDEDDYVAFSGSSNESRNALENNRECIDVYPSWRSPKRADRKRKHFEEVWNGNDKGVDVYSFPEAGRRKLIRICEERIYEDRIQEDHGTSSWSQNKESHKWRHQEEACEKFIAAERGVLNMATGTGKTWTAVKILKALFHAKEIDTVIVCTDGNDLLDQWYVELLRARGRDVRIFRHYGQHKQNQKFTLDPIDAFLLVSRQFVASALRRLNTAVCRRTLMIHDEVHGLGSPGNRNRLAGLSDSIRFRLGLSATPERPYDLEGNEFIEAHIGPELMTFGLQEAIERGILAPFNYHPLPYVPTNEDKERLTALYGKRKAREIEGNPMTETEFWIEIARVYKTSKAKLPVFEDFIEDYQELLKRCIIFTETMEYGVNVLEIVHKFRPDFHTYFSGEESSILQRFANGQLECLITCHRLSEGIDIQSLNSVILFSSERGQLETIQRIGRCLRTNPKDPEKVANIVDFIRDGDNKAGPNADEERRNWLTDLSKVRAVE